MISVSLFRWLAEFAPDMSHAAIGLLTFSLVVIPTVMMGFTLPLLVSHEVRKNGNVGSSVGQLYFVNTAGSAIASLAAAGFMMASLGETRSVFAAAVLNVAVATFVFLQSLRTTTG
jgi:predicted membrane-bound spermidine synthase